MAAAESQKIKSSRIAITGGAGFVGTALALRLVQEGAAQVVVLDAKPQPPEALKDAIQQGAVKYCAFDVRDAQAVSQALAGMDYVYHLAAIRVTHCAKEPRLAHEIMVDGTFNTAMACIEHKVKKIILASSAIVYGQTESDNLEETDHAEDTTLYGVFKLANEALLRSFAASHGLNYTVLRYFNLYGRGMNIRGAEIEVMIRWLDKLDAGEAPVIFGDGKQMLDYVHIDDVVEANIRALTAPVTGEIFNVCTGKATTLLELLKLLIRLTGTPVEPVFEAPRAVNQVARRVGSPRKAAAGLGFKTAVDLEEGLKDLITWRAGQKSMTA